MENHDDFGGELGTSATAYDFAVVRLIEAFYQDSLPPPPPSSEAAWEEMLAAAVCPRVGLQRSEWIKLNPAQRIPWIDKAVNTVRAEADRVQEPDATAAPTAEPQRIWMKQAEVARRLGIKPMVVHRLLEEGRLRDNGEKLHKRRVDKLSAVEYAEEEGLTWNET